MTAAVPGSHGRVHDDRRRHLGARSTCSATTPCRRRRGLPARRHVARPGGGLRGRRQRGRRRLRPQLAADRRAGRDGPRLLGAGAALRHPRRRDAAALQRTAQGGGPTARVAAHGARLPDRRARAAAVHGADHARRRRSSATISRASKSSCRKLRDARLQARLPASDLPPHSHPEATHAQHQDPHRQDPQARLRQDAEDLQDRLRQGRPALFAARAGQDLPGREPAAGVDPHRAGERAAQLRRQEGHRRARGAARALAGRTPSAPTRSRSSSPASCCRTSPACRCWPTWPPCATWPTRWARTRSASSRWCRWTWWSTTRDDRPLRHARRRST